jgi:hypothetical protein
MDAPAGPTLPQRHDAERDNQATDAPHPWESRFLVGSCPNAIPAAFLQRDQGCGGAAAAQCQLQQQGFTVGSCPDMHVIRTPPTAPGRRHPYSTAADRPPAGPASRLAGTPTAALRSAAAPAAAPAVPQGAAARRQLFGVPSRDELEQFFAAQEEQVGGWERP